MFKKRHLLSRLWLKHTDKPSYRAYKWMLKNHKQVEFAEFIQKAGQLTSPEKILSYAKSKGVLKINHSGNAGDIMYALPTIKRLHEMTGARIELYLKLNQPLTLAEFVTHPLGNVMLNQKMVDMLMPLLRLQPYISSCEVYNNEEIDVDMDYFRKGGVPTDKGNIARWCSYLTGINPQLWKPWLEVEPDLSYADTIVMARSERYRNYTITYDFLAAYKNIVFIGVESEYTDIKKVIPHIKWIKVPDFMKMAQIIAGSKFFIGNQSFPFSIAESLKVPRILEPSFEVINVVPEGEDGYDFFFQEHLESLVKMLNDRR